MPLPGPGGEVSYYRLRTFSSEEGIEEFGDDNQIDTDRGEFLGKMASWSSLSNIVSKTVIRERKD